MAPLPASTALPAWTASVARCGVSESGTLHSYRASLIDMTVPLSDTTRALVDEKNYATISTVGADGGPQSSVVWVFRGGDDLLFSTLRDRQKERNLRADPRASVSVWSLADPLVYAEIRDTVTIAEDTDRAVVDAVARKYTGTDFPGEPADRVRVVLRLTPTKVTGNAA